MKPSEWMECFYRRPRSTFFHSRTSVCLFLFQIHSIIPDCSKHSRSPTFLFPLQPGSTTTTLLLLPGLTPAPTHQRSSFSFHHSSLWMDVAQEKTLYFLVFSPCWGIWVRLDEGKALIAQAHLAGTQCSYKWKWVKADTMVQQIFIRLVRPSSGRDCRRL